MKLEINIPKEFEEHFKTDKFEDSLQRVRYDIHKAFVGKKELLSGRYEIKLLDMLTEAFMESECITELTDTSFEAACIANFEEFKAEFKTLEEFKAELKEAFEWGGEGD